MGRTPQKTTESSEINKIPEISETPENNLDKFHEITLNYKKIVFLILFASGGLGTGLLIGDYIDRSDQQKSSLDKVNNSIDGLKGNPVNYLLVDGLNCIDSKYLGDLNSKNCVPNMKVILDILSIKSQDNKENDLKMLKGLDILFILEGNTDNKRREFLKDVFNNSGLDISFLIDNLDPKINPNLIKFLEEINPQLSLFEKGNTLLKKYKDPQNSEIITKSVTKTAQILGDSVKQNGPKGTHVNFTIATGGHVNMEILKAIDDSGFAQIDPELFDRNKKLDLIKQIKDQVWLLKDLLQKKEKLKINKGIMSDSDYQIQMSQIENEIIKYKKDFNEWIMPYLLPDPTIIDSTIFDSSIGGTFIFPILQHLFKNIKVEDMEKMFENTEKAYNELIFSKGVGLFNDCIYLEIISKLIAESMFEDYSRTHTEIEFPDLSKKNDVITYTVKYYYQELVKEFKDKEKMLEKNKSPLAKRKIFEKSGKQGKLSKIGNQKIQKKFNGRRK